MIKTLDRYLLKRFVVSFLIALGAIMLIGLIVDLIENLEPIVDNAAAPRDVFLYYLYFLPWLYKIIVPAATLLAGLFTIGLLARTNEILAMKAAGISLYRIALPILIFALLLSLVNFYFNEEVLPRATAERLRIKRSEIKKESDPTGALLQNVSKQGEGGIMYHFDTFSATRAEAKGALIQRFEGDSLRESYRAERLKFNGTAWVAYKGAYRSFAGGKETFLEFDTLIIPGASERPEEFTKYRGNPDDMGYRELKGYIEVLKKTGGVYLRELVNLKTKLSFPFTSFIVIFLCVPLASNPRRSGVAVSFAIASSVSLIYVVIFKVTQSLGYSGRISPDLAAWSINVIFLFIGVVAFLRAHK